MSESQPPQESRFHRAAGQVAVFAENRWVIFTEKFILVVLGVIIAVDLFLALNDVEGDTISEVIKGWAYQRFFVLTWAWGVLAGHLFLTSANAILPAPWNIWVLLAVTAVILIVGLGAKGTIGVPLQAVLLLSGVVAGHLLWPQSPVT